MGKNGALELVHQAALRSKSGNKFTAWREVTPLHNALVDAMVQANLHLIVTMRAKTEHIIETDDRGRQVPRKIGVAPIQRDGLEFEFDVVADMDPHRLEVSLQGTVRPQPEVKRTPMFCRIAQASRGRRRLVFFRLTGTRSSLFLGLTSLVTKTNRL